MRYPVSGTIESGNVSVKIIGTMATATPGVPISGHVVIEKKSDFLEIISKIGAGEVITITTPPVEKRKIKVTSVDFGNRVLRYHVDVSDR